MATITERYKQALKDLNRLEEIHDNPPYDMTGGWVEGEKLTALLASPSKKKALEIIESLIEHSAYSGFEGGPRDSSKSPIFENSEVSEIYARYGLDAEDYELS